MATKHHYRRVIPATAPFLALAETKTKQAIALVAAFLIAANCLAQDQPPAQPDSPASSQAPAPPPQLSVVTVPAGTRIALVLTHPIQTRYVHRGDDIYAQVTSPVTSGTEVIIPPGTFVQGKMDKLERRGGRGELHLQSMSITFPDGYVAPVAGPVTLESPDGYALKDPGNRRTVEAFALPMAGAGAGALIGHFAASSQPNTITSTLPPGCTGPPPGCLSSSLTTPGSTAKGTIIGAMVGGVAGAVASLVLLTNTRNFFLDVGSPVAMVLQQPMSLDQGEVAEAVQQSEQQPVPEQVIAPRPLRPAPSFSNSNTDHGTCYTPDTPGTQPTIIPGTPAIGDSPGTPDTVILGTPSIPGTPYPCP
jgi:hypothetical protein